jgi:hypothetical protein
MDVMRELFNICNPLKPPPEGPYVDLSPVRGDSATIDMMSRRIRRSKTPAHLLFSGHPGGGKSTKNPPVPLQG